MKRKIKLILVLLVVGFAVIQFFRPERFTSNEVTNDHIFKKMQVPENVQSILKRSCYDCHSNHTVWPWYSNVAPISWFVVSDVNEGRRKMNLSEWGKLTEKKQIKRLTDICDEITENRMPLGQYVIIHGDAKLSDTDKDVLCKWVKSVTKEGEENETEEKEKK
jgi:hypothetical protein